MLSGMLQKALGVGGLATGIGGSVLLARHLGKQQRRHAEENDVEAARNEYLAALTGEKSAALDAAYEKYARLADVVNNVSSGLQSFGRGAQTAVENAGAAELLAAAAGLGIGGTYMYNKTRDNSLSANALKAQALKARMRSLPGTWIDPEELVKVKQMAMANNAAAT
jgi:predicted S18 family serine protease